MRRQISQKLVISLKPKAAPYEIRDTKLPGFILRVQPTGTKSYICQYARGKRVTLGNVAILTPAQAREKALNVLATATNGGDPTRKRDKVKTLGDFIEKQYGPWAEQNRKSGKATVARIKACFGGLWGKKLGEVNAWVIEKWRSDRLKSGIAPATLNRDVTALKAALSKAVAWGCLSDQLLQSVKPLKTDSHGIIRYLLDDEASRLREALDKRRDYLRPMVLLALNTGMRRGEIFQLRWSDVDFGRAMVSVRGITAKSASTRHIPLNTEASEALQQWRKQSDNEDLVFPSREGKPFDNVRRSWLSLMKAAKITGFRFHDLRHDFASQLVMSGVDINTVRELLGHGDIKMTLRYAHLAPEHKAEAVSRLAGGSA